MLALETMPCGCVAGVYQARPSVVEVEFVEAKGPHCVFARHRAGHVTRLGVPESLAAETGEPLIRPHLVAKTGPAGLFLAQFRIAPPHPIPYNQRWGFY